jgi:hypothetical protein
VEVEDREKKVSQSVRAIANDVAGSEIFTGRSKEKRRRGRGRRNLKVRMHDRLMLNLSLLLLLLEIVTASAMFAEFLPVSSVTDQELTLLMTRSRARRTSVFGGKSRVLDRSKY